MRDEQRLTEDQLARIEATLKRIRGGLKTIAIEPLPEPAHLFVPETQHAS